MGKCETAPSPDAVPADGPPVATIRHDREVPRSTYPLPCCIAAYEPRRAIGRTLTTQENLYDATSGAAVPQGRRRRRTGVDHPRLGSPLTRCEPGSGADHAVRPMRDRHPALRGFPKRETGHPEHRGLVLDSAAVCEDDSSHAHECDEVQIGKGLWADQSLGSRATRRLLVRLNEVMLRESRPYSGVHGEDHWQ